MCSDEDVRKAISYERNTHDDRSSSLLFQVKYHSTFVPQPCNWLLLHLAVYPTHIGCAVLIIANLEVKMCLDQHYGRYLNWHTHAFYVDLIIRLSWPRDGNHGLLMPLLYLHAFLSLSPSERLSVEVSIEVRRRH
jgi:hypothetical protein